MAGAAKLLETLAAAVPLAKQAAKNIRAFHASPHDFDKFDLRKVGTGQGAQSYGHGIYFAENPKVSGVGGEYWKEFARHFTGSGPDVDPVVSHAVQYLEHLGGDRKAALKMVNEAIVNTGNMPQRPRLEAVRDLLASDKPVGPRVYEVDIKARPEQFLDWDKPITQQPAAVRDVLLPGDMRGVNRSTPAGTFYDNLKSARGGEAVSQSLRDAGIPGVRYLDHGSRQSLQLQKIIDQSISPDRVAIAQKELSALPPPTSNYVLFDDKLIDILKKYLVPGAIGTGTMAAGARQEQ